MTAVISMATSSCTESRAVRPVASIVLALLLPTQLLGQESATAMVYANGAAWVNGTEVPKSSAVFKGDTLQTRQDSSANLNTNGSSIIVLPDCVVKYEGPSVDVDQGTVRVSTSSGFMAHACDVKATPANVAPAQYQFTHSDKHVEVIAIKGDVIVDDHRESKTVKEGQQITREDGCEVAEKRNPKRRGAASTAASGGILSSPGALYTGVGIVVGVTIWVLVQGDDPLSPACPDKTCMKK